MFAPDLSRATISYGSTINPRAVLDASRSVAATYLRLDLDASVTRARSLLAEQYQLTDERTSVSASVSAAAPSDADAILRRTRIATIDARLAAIRAEVDGLFRSHAS